MPRDRTPLFDENTMRMLRVRDRDEIPDYITIGNERIERRATPKLPKIKPLSVRDFIGKRPNKMTFGLEIEVFLAYKHRRHGINIVRSIEDNEGNRQTDAFPIENIINKTQDSHYSDRVYRDYYHNQVELRTPPTSDPGFLFKDMDETYNHVNDIITNFNTSNSRIVERMGELIMFPSSVMKNMNTTCGTHLHVKPNNMFNMFVNSYPLLIPFMENSRSCPDGQNTLSMRQAEVRHISNNSTNYAQDSEVLKYKFSRMSNRGCDIIINRNKKTHPGDRHRVKKVNTLEYRVFDTNWDYKYMKDLILLFSEVLKHLKQSKIVKYDNNLLRQTRDEAVYTKYGYNYIFDKPNIEVLQEIAEIFGFNVRKLSTPIMEGFYENTAQGNPLYLLPMIKW